MIINYLRKYFSEKNHSLVDDPIFITNHFVTIQFPSDNHRYMVKMCGGSLLLERLFMEAKGGRKNSGGYYSSGQLCMTCMF